MKYIIDLPDDLVTYGGELCTVTGFKLIPYNESEVEQRGIDKAWGLAQELENMEFNDWENCFHSPCVDGITKMSFNEANEQYKAWRKRKNKIKIGDEVEFANGSRFVVYDILPSGRLCGCGYNHCSGEHDSWMAVNPESVKKTGRHFNEVVEVLEKMKEPK